MTSYQSAMVSIIIIIIIMTFINSAAVSKIRHAAGTCHSVLTKRCAFRSRAKVAVDSIDRRSSTGKLFQVSGPETAKFLQPIWLWLSVAHRVCRRRPTAGVDVLWDERPASRAQRDTGVLGLADICWPASRSCIVSAGRLEANAVDRRDVVEFTCSGDHPRRGDWNSLELPNDAISDFNQ